MSTDTRRCALPAGTRVQELEILNVIGGGGFGIVYLAQDHQLQRRVALREYMPHFAARTGGSTEVFVPSDRDVEAFGTGLRSFVNESRLLARLEHPALVQVHRFWEENGTAYMLMPYYEGPTLQRAVAEKRVPADEESLRRLLDPLMDAVGLLHREQCCHRDIAPDNILLTPQGPVLLDLGSARLASEAVIIKGGYAPLEQYTTEESTAITAARQGPWTDIYALGGVIRFVITGRSPLSAVIRVAEMKDPLEPLASMQPVGVYTEPFVRALDRAMAIHVENRPQSIQEFRALLSPRSAFEPVTLVRALAHQPRLQSTTARRAVGCGVVVVGVTLLLIGTFALLPPGGTFRVVDSAPPASISGPTEAAYSAPSLSKSGLPSPTEKAAQGLIAPWDPALLLMVKAARAGSWRALEGQAAAIARVAKPQPEGNHVEAREQNELGRAALRIHNFPKAVAAFEKGMQQDPAAIEIANNYGYTLALAGRRAEAQDVLTRVLLRDPAREVAWIALVEARGEDSPESLAALKIALHFAVSRERTLMNFREMALTHRDPHVRSLVKTLLEQADRVPTVPEGNH